MFNITPINNSAKCQEQRFVQLMRDSFIFRARELAAILMISISLPPTKVCSCNLLGQRCSFRLTSLYLYQLPLHPHRPHNSKTCDNQRYPKRPCEPAIITLKGGSVIRRLRDETSQTGRSSCNHQSCVHSQDAGKTTGEVTSEEVLAYQNHECSTKELEG